MATREVTRQTVELSGYATIAAVIIGPALLGIPAAILAATDEEAPQRAHEAA